jgi:predicted outer membrane protein
MYWKHGLVLLAATAFTVSAIAQERQREGQPNREGAAAGAQQVGGAQDRQEAQRRENQERTGAQDRTGTQQRQGAEGRQGRGQNVDQQVATMLAWGNYEEVQLGQFASQKSQNPQVKEFAQKMVEHHNQGLQKLQRFLPAGQWEQLQMRSSEGAAGTRPGATGAAGARPTEGARDDQNRPNEERPGAARAADDQIAAAGQAERRQAAAGQNEQRPGEGRGAAGQGEQRGGAMQQIARETAQRCLQRTKEILNEKQGAQFDECYIGQQVMAHVGMLAKLEASQNHVSPEFQQVIRESTQTVEQHLKEAQTIARSLEQQGGGQRGARPGAGRAPGQDNPGAGQQ